MSSATTPTRPPDLRIKALRRFAISITVFNLLDDDRARRGPCLVRRRFRSDTLGAHNGNQYECREWQGLFVSA